LLLRWLLRLLPWLLWLRLPERLIVVARLRRCRGNGRISLCL